MAISAKTSVRRVGATDLNNSSRSATPSKLFENYNWTPAGTGIGSSKSGVAQPLQLGSTSNANKIQNSLADQKDIQNAVNTSLGYFVFPPGSSYHSGVAAPLTTRHPDVHGKDATPAPSTSLSPSAAVSSSSLGATSNGFPSSSTKPLNSFNTTASGTSSTSRTTRDQQSQPDPHQHRQLPEQSKAIAEESELEWVRAGGILRTPSGRRDRARTEAARKEIALRARERAVMLAWESYEARAKALFSSSSSSSTSTSTSASASPPESESDASEPSLLSYADFPWPVFPASEDGNDIDGAGGGNDGGKPGHLTPDRVIEFLTAPLAVRGANKAGVTRKERLRSTMLRWHPDKLTRVLARVRPEDLRRVLDSMRLVTESCKVALEMDRGGAS